MQEFSDYNIPIGLITKVFFFCETFPFKATYLSQSSISYTKTLNEENKKLSHNCPSRAGIF